MAAFVWTAALMVGTALVAALVLEYMLRGVVRSCARLLPDEICGPDGWLVDTTRCWGVFDRPARR